MKKIFVLFLLCANISFAQKPSIYFRLDKWVNWGFPNNNLFRGISGIDYHSATKTWYFVSDKWGDYFKFDKNTNIFDAPDSDIQIFKNDTLIGGESIRFFENNLYYCKEQNDSLSIVGVLPSVKIHKIDLQTKNKNRGFEGLTLSPMGDSLFVSIESSTEFQDESPYTDIILYKRVDGSFSNTNKTIFKYPFDKYSCSKVYNGWRGNGISEILFLDKNNLLVLERCFDGNSGKVKLFQATLNLNNTITKTQVVCFNNFGSTYTPENIEGMTWGPLETNNRRTLYLISDDNFDDNLHTQLIKLVEID